MFYLPSYSGFIVILFHLELWWKSTTYIYPCVYSLLQNTGFYLQAKVVSLCWTFLLTEGDRRKAVSVILQVGMPVLLLILESYQCSSDITKGRFPELHTRLNCLNFCPVHSPLLPPTGCLFFNKGMNLITWGRDWNWRLSFSLWFAAEAKLFLFPLESLFSEHVIYTRWASCRLKMPPGWIKLSLP